MSLEAQNLRWALGLEYDGSAYHGWQTQAAPALNTIQWQVERALSQIADHPIQVICAGRTDRGVHATAQVIHFDSSAKRNAAAWINGGNAKLPADIRILWASVVNEQFHARYSAQSRRYHYIIFNSPIRPALLRQRVSWIPYPLDAVPMQTAANFLLGEHDFSAFRGADCQAKTTVRRVEHIRVQRQEDFLIIDIQANAFLHHMVRNIAGALLAVGAGRRSPEWLLEILHSRDRKSGGVTAPADGLYLVGVHYPEEFHIGSSYTPHPPPLAGEGK